MPQLNGKSMTVLIKMKVHHLRAMNLKKNLLYKDLGVSQIYNVQRSQIIEPVSHTWMNIISNNFRN